MARKVAQMPNRYGNRAQYPWSDWFDGDVWELTADEDFKVKPARFRATAYMAAARRSMQISVMIRDDLVYIQARRLPQ